MLTRPIDTTWSEILFFQESRQREGSEVFPALERTSDTRMPGVSCNYVNSAFLPKKEEQEGWQERKESPGTFPTKYIRCMTAVLIPEINFRISDLCDSMELVTRFARSLECLCAPCFSSSTVNLSPMK